jgi:hypothetical protein
MEDFKNINIYKLMCLFDHPNVLWDVQKEFKKHLND